MLGNSLLAFTIQIGDRMKKVQRFDTARVRAHFDSNGFMVDTPTVARIGLQIYIKHDGTERREFRPASEVFNPDSLRTYQGKPITLGHTVVNSKNARDIVVGACSGVGIRNGIGVDVPLTVYDEVAINKAKQKIAAELSVGYSSHDLEEPGWGNNVTGEYQLDSQILGDKSDSAEAPPPPDDSGNWVRFDAVQTQIEVNHIAMVFKGRAGIAKLNLDSEQDFPYIEDESIQPIKKDSDMKTIKIDGVEVQVPENVAAHIAKLDEANTSVTAQLSTANAKADQLQTQVDGFQSKLDAAVATAVAAVKADAEALGEVKAFAETLGVKCDGLDVKGIKVACIKELSGIDASQKDDAYINSSFDFARESDKLAANRVAVMGKQDGQNKEDAADNVVPDPQKRFRK